MRFFLLKYRLIRKIKKTELASTLQGKAEYMAKLMNNPVFIAFMKIKLLLLHQKIKQGYVNHRS